MPRLLSETAPKLEGTITNGFSKVARDKDDRRIVGYMAKWFFIIVALAVTSGILTKTGEGGNIGYPHLWWSLTVAIHPIMTLINYRRFTDLVRWDTERIEKQVRLIGNNKGKEYGRALVLETQKCRDRFPENHPRLYDHWGERNGNPACEDCETREELILKLKGLTDTQAIEDTRSFLQGRKELGV